MKLIHREPSAAQSEANRANSRLSTGPRSAQGKAVSSRNLPKPRLYSRVVARSMVALGETPSDFEQTHKTLSAAMEPRDAWEAAWVQDIAVLRWRLERLHRAEVGSMAVRRRKLWRQRQREILPKGGSVDLAAGNLIGIVGYTGMPDSPLKFQQTIELFHVLRYEVAEGRVDPSALAYLDILYGKGPRTQGMLLKIGFERMLKQREQNGAVDAATRQTFLADLDKEFPDMSNWRRSTRRTTRKTTRSNWKPICFCLPRTRRKSSATRGTWRICSTASCASSTPAAGSACCVRPKRCRQWPRILGPRSRPASLQWLDRSRRISWQGRTTGENVIYDAHWR